MDDKNAYSARQLKVSENLKRLISEVINIDRVLEHYINNIYITISEVSISPDLKNAKIFIIPSCDVKEREKIAEIINQHSYEISRVLGRRIKMKFTPRLIFIYDNILDRVEKLDNIFDNIDK